MELVPPPASLFKLYALSTDLQWARLERLMSHGEIYFAKPSDFNDPFDCAPAFDPRGVLDRRSVLEIHNNAGLRKGHNRQERRFRARRFIAQPRSAKVEALNTIGLKRVQNVGVFCMTDRRDHPLMWSHYADKHSGIAIEFAADVGPFQLAQQVRYAKNLPVFDFRSSDIEGFANMYLTKAHFWAYETEYRLLALNIDNSPRLDLLRGHENDHDLMAFVVRKETSGVHHVSTRLIRGINFGCACSAETVNRVQSLCKTYGLSVSFHHAKKKPGRFELSFEKATS